MWGISYLQGEEAARLQRLRLSSTHHAAHDHAGEAKSGLVLSHKHFLTLPARSI
jgi:hypothetical protein